MIFTNKANYIICYASNCDTTNNTAVDILEMVNITLELFSMQKKIFISDIPDYI